MKTLRLFSAEFLFLRFCEQMISNLQKDDRIKKVLKKLFQRFGESNFYLTNYWDADLTAIGIKNSEDGEFLIYLSTYHIQKDHYFVEVENSSKGLILNGYKNGELNEINFIELCEIVTKYLIQPNS